jgi:hypothetical protein
VRGRGPSLRPSSAGPRPDESAIINRRAAQQDDEDGRGFAPPLIIGCWADCLEPPILMDLLRECATRRRREVIPGLKLPFSYCGWEPRRWGHAAVPRSQRVCPQERTPRRARSTAPLRPLMRAHSPSSLEHPPSASPHASPRHDRHPEPKTPPCGAAQRPKGPTSGRPRPTESAIIQRRAAQHDDEDGQGLRPCRLSSGVGQTSWDDMSAKDQPKPRLECDHIEVISCLRGLMNRPGLLTPSGSLEEVAAFLIGFGLGLQAHPPEQDELTALLDWISDRARDKLAARSPSGLLATLREQFESAEQFYAAASAFLEKRADPEREAASLQGEAR